LFRFVKGCSKSLQPKRLRNGGNTLFYTFSFSNHLPTYAFMSSYPTGGPGLYYGADPQQGVYHDPPQQFDPYNTRLAHDAYEHGEGEYREPYKDEPIASYSLPQGQSMEPLEPTTKEEISYYAEETNATPRKPRYV
jgi:hypothetical protein